MKGVTIIGDPEIKRIIRDYDEKIHTTQLGN